jgi:hypothetical protein
LAAPVGGIDVPRLTDVRRVLLAVGAVALLSSVGGAAAIAQEPEQPEPTPSDPITHRGDQYIPKPAGTKETLKFWYGPYEVPPGWDANRLDVNIPIESGMVLSIEPDLRMAEDMSVPSHQVAHIHHAHWFTLNPGSENDNYFQGTADWMFGNGDEETKADFQQRSAAQPKGPVYGSFIDASEPGPVIYMLHNKTSRNLLTYIALDITFIHGTKEQLEALDGRPYHDVTGTLFGRTFDVPRDFDSKDGTWETAEDDPKGPIEWTSPVDGTLIGTGSHVHPGGLRVITENYGSAEDPCPDAGNGC